MNRKFDRYIKTLVKQEKMDIPNEFETKTEHTMKQLPVKGYGTIEQKPVRQYRWSLKVVYIAIALVVLSSASVFAYGYHQYKLTNSTGFKNHEYLSTENGNVQTIDQTTTSDNIRATLKEVKADANNMYVTVEIKTQDGSDLLKSTEDSVAMMGNQGFEKAYIVVDNAKVDFTMVSRTDDYSDATQAIFELCYNESSVSIPSLVGKDISVVLENYYYGVITSQTLGFTYSDVGTMLNNVKLAGENDFSTVGVYMSYADGTEFPAFTLNAGKEKLYFSKKYPGTYIDNVGIHEWGESNRKCLYVSIVPESDEVRKQILSEEDTLYHGSNIEMFNVEEGKYNGGQQPYIKVSNGGIVTMKNVADGTITKVDMGGKCVQPNDGRIVLFFDIGEASELTIEQLSNYVLRTDYAEAIKTVDSTLGFTFKLDHVNEILSYDVDKIYKRNEATATVSKISISDSYIIIEGTGEANFGWKAHGDIHLILSDGTKVDAGPKIGGGYDSNTGIFSLDANLSTLVDADEVTGIEFWGETIELK